MSMEGTSSTVLSIWKQKCEHSPESRTFKAFSLFSTFEKLEANFLCHDDGFMEIALSSCPNGPWTALDGSESSAMYEQPIGVVLQQFPETKYIRVRCLDRDTPQEDMSCCSAAESPSLGKRSVFDDMMSSQRLASKRSLPDKKTRSAGVQGGLTRKDELYNHLLDWMDERGLRFSNPTQEGHYVTQVICNALWYITNNHTTINEAARKKTNVLPIPTAFDDFEAFNDVKRKKMKALQLTSQELNSHGQAIYSLLLKPSVNSSPSWVKASSQIKQLADCILAYKEHLIEQNKIVKKNHNLDHPVRSIDNDATLEHRTRNPFGVKERYTKLNLAVLNAGELNPVFFDEFVHVDKPFQTNDERYRFFQHIQLSVPIDIIRFSPGGSCISTMSIVSVKENRTEAEILTQGGRFLQQTKPALKEFHTRAQRRLFKERLSNVASILPSVADLIYKELTLDASVASHPVTQERLRLIFLGDSDLIPDLRVLNPGRPNNTYDTFFEALSGIIENITAADDRRHGMAHLSEFISLHEMIDKAVEACPEGTPVPSKSLVRLQFAPRNPYAKAALNFTSRIQVQYKIQRRQLRVAHCDDHYCNAQLKYLKQRAIELKDNCVLLFCDDKAKISCGEPGSPISTGVRGKKSIVPTTTTLVALDHDMTKTSITPSVILKCRVPDAIEDSFVRGKVITTLNDSVFQVASPFRHAAFIVKSMEQTEIPPVLLKFTDGGTDQRNTLESVKCASICLFREFNLDMLILARCAPGHSYTNPAERIMSLLNIALQNVSLERKESDKDTEKALKNTNSMAALRILATNKPDLKQAWSESLEEVTAMIRNRFLRLKLKDEPFTAFDPVSDLEIDTIKRHLRELFSDLDLNKLQKANTCKVKSYNTWMEAHCRARQYTFQIRKCEDENCCLPSRLPREELQWLPDPILDETGEHFKPYQDVKNLDTDENDRPSLKNKAVVVKKKRASRSEDDKDINEQESRPEDDEDEEEPIPDPQLCTTQNARAVVDCIECRKPRVIYSHQKLTERHLTSITTAISDFDYTCGGPLLPPSNSLYKKVMCRNTLLCSSPIELPYYGSGLGHIDACAYCGALGAETDIELKRKYKTVLPICDNCCKEGKTPIVQRPFGKDKNK